MDFKELCGIIGFQFLIASVAIVLKCICKFIHKGAYTPDNPLQPSWCTILCGLTFILSLPVYIFLHFAFEYLAELKVQFYRQEKREIDEKLHESYYNQGYRKGYDAGIAAGKEIGYRACEVDMQKR